MMDLEIATLSEVRQRQISYEITYMWNLFKKMVQINLFTKQIVTHVENKLIVTGGGCG